MGEKPDIDFYGADALKINNGYWANVMESLYNEGCITGISIINSASIQGIKAMDFKITQKGIEYLQGNLFMAKAKDFLKTVKEIISGV